LALVELLLVELLVSELLLEQPARPAMVARLAPPMNDLRLMFFPNIDFLLVFPRIP